jgi:hypothetical protein
MNFIRLGGESESDFGLSIVVLVVPGFVFYVSIMGGERKVVSLYAEGIIFQILLVHL